MRGKWSVRKREGQGFVWEGKATWLLLKLMQGEEHEGSWFYICDYSWDKNYSLVCELVEVEINEHFAKWSWWE